MGVASVFASTFSIGRGDLHPALKNWVCREVGIVDKAQDWMVGLLQSSDSSDKQKRKEMTSREQGKPVWKPSLKEPFSHNFFSSQDNKLVGARADAGGFFAQSL